MNYKKIYNNIIENRLQNKFDGYTERHHIIPKSLGGLDNKENLVELSAREHFICHYLLIKIYKDDKFKLSKMINAFSMMFCKSHCNNDRYSPSRNYEYFRKQFSKVQSENQTGKSNSQYGTCWVHNLKEKDNKKIKVEELNFYLSLGWEKGRKTIFEETKSQKFLRERRENRDLKDELNIQNQTSIYEEYYKIYKEVGFNIFVELTGYTKSKQNLVQQFKKYVKDFIPQNGKKDKELSNCHLNCARNRVEEIIIDFVETVGSIPTCWAKFVTLVVVIAGKNSSPCIGGKDVGS